MGAEPEALKQGVAKSWLNRRLVLLLLLIPYLAVELGFNHRLLTLSSGIVDANTLKGMETWGRIISGVGFGLLLWAFILGQRLRALPGLLLCLVLGVSVMWQFQKFVLDYWVRNAPLEDKRISLALAVLALPASVGILKTEQGPLLKKPPSPALQLTVASLFPATALHAAQREDRVLGWTRQLGSSYSAADLARVTPEMADNAYRNLIVPPLALGLSLLVAMLNMAQLGAALIRFTAQRMGRDTVWLRLTQPVLAAALIAGSAMACNAYARSPAFQQLLRPGMWEQSPVLATLTEWTLHAEPQWHGLAQWAHEVILMKASFSQPWPLPL